MINKVLHLKFKCIVLSCFVQKSTEHICFDLLLNLPPNMLIRLGNLSWFVTEALGGNGLNPESEPCGSPLTIPIRVKLNRVFFPH